MTVNKDIIKQKSRKNIVHGKCGTNVYHIWKSMRARCLSKTSKSFKNYGGRGIEICSRWNIFRNFLEDMGEPPSSQYSLDRIDNNGNYSKENCRWATKKEQANNSRSNIKVEYNGETRTIAQWCEVMDFNYFRARLLWKKYKDWDFVIKNYYNLEQDYEGEEWKSIIGYEDFYKISNFSRIKNMKGAILIISFICGHPRFFLKKNKKQISLSLYKEYCKHFNHVPKAEFMKMAESKNPNARVYAKEICNQIFNKESE